MSNPVVLVDTTKGEFLVELFADKAPLTVANFWVMWTMISM